MLCGFAAIVQADTVPKFEQTVKTIASDGHGRFKKVFPYGT
jgi:hypothetical protein